MFAISYLWPRHENSKFKNKVYVLLQKPGRKNDIYNITAILELLEATIPHPHIGLQVALVHCLGGNDYLPKFYGMSHVKVLSTFLKHPEFLTSLFPVASPVTNTRLHIPTYINFIKCLYCPKKFDAMKLKFDEVCQVTIQLQNAKKGQKTRNPQSWMPPASVLQQLGKLVNCQVKYLFTAGDPVSPLPDFLTEGCLKKTEKGNIEYDLGPDSYIGDIEDMLVPLQDLQPRLQQAKQPRLQQAKQPGKKKDHQGKSSTEIPRERASERDTGTTKSLAKSGKRKQQETPQKGDRRKHVLTSTPKRNTHNR
jgi:hypothetical protein